MRNDRGSLTIRAWLQRMVGVDRELRPIMITTYERGMMAGRLQLAIKLLEVRFGTLSPEVRQRVESMSPDDLERTMLSFYKADSLKDLGLEDR